MAILSDFNFSNENKVQVYLSGNLHGDEQLGPNALTYLAEFLVKNYDSNDFVKQLLRHAVLYLYLEKEK